MQTHEMKLLREPFLEMRSGRKNVEMRLYDEKRQGIAAGDEIYFTCPELAGEALHVRVEATYIYEDFHSLAENFAPGLLGFGGRTAEYISEYMEKIYGREKVKKYGAFAIKIALLK